MYHGQVVFSQLMDPLPRRPFDSCVDRYDGDRRVRSFSCRDQFLCMAFAQLTYRESLRDIETCLRALGPKLYHGGLRGRVSRNTLARANELRDWRIWADLAQVLIAKARPLYAAEGFGVELGQTAYAFDSTTIDLCLSLFPWAKFRKRKAAIKLHTLIDLRGSIPCFIRITEGKTHDVNALDHLPIEPGAFYVMDRGYTDFARLYALDQGKAFFVIRAKSNLDYTRVARKPVDKATGLRSDQTITFSGAKSCEDYPDRLRRVSYTDLETGKRLVFLTNNFTLDALTIARLYKARWRVELFFEWIKQHLRIKAFYGTSPNAVKTQVWVAICVYVLVAIVRKQLAVGRSLAQILQILSICLFEKTPMITALTASLEQNAENDNRNQLMLFDF